MLSSASGAGGTVYGTFQSINIGYALGLVIAVYVSIEASGAHLNPAVSWAMAIKGNLSWLMVSHLFAVVCTRYQQVVYCTVIIIIIINNRLSRT